MSEGKKTSKKDERGVALLIVIIVSIMFALLGLSMTFDSMTDLSINHDLENRKKAFATADAGYNWAKRHLRGKDLSVEMKSIVTVPRWVPFTPPTGATELAYWNRNPLPPVLVRNTDFSNLPTPSGSFKVSGLITAAAGTDVPYEPHSGSEPHVGCHADDHRLCGRFWVRISDDNDGDGIDEDLITDTNGDGDPTNDLFVDDETPGVVDADDDGVDDTNGDPLDHLEDTNGIIWIRIMGVQRIGAGQVSTYGGTVKNAISILEVKMERDTSLNLSSPFSLEGPAVGPAQAGNYFAGGVPYLDGINHVDTLTLADIPLAKIHSKAHIAGDTAGIDVMHDDSGGGDAATVRNTIYLELLSPDNRDQLIGDKTDYASGADGSGAPLGPLDQPWNPTGSEPSLRDATQKIRDDTNPDAGKIFDANYLMDFINRAAGVADITVPNAATVGSGSFGTTADPKITYCSGDCALNGGEGAGILIVRGRLDVTGAFKYHGLILVVGDGAVDMGGTNLGGVLGGIFVAEVDFDAGKGGYYFDQSNFTLHGTANFWFQGAGVRLGYTLFPMKAVSWREITPELEP